MPFKATFTKSGTAPLVFEQVKGYQISACFTLGTGFNNQFYVYLVEELLAAGRLKAIHMPNNPADFRGKLALGDEDRNYAFEDIDLLGLEPYITRGHRCRVLEFRYDATVTNKGINAKLEFTKAPTLPKNDLGDDYTFSLPGGQKENLLGFRARLTAGESPVYRFYSYRTNKHSWLGALLEATSNGGKFQPDFTCNFAQGAMPIKENVTSRVYVTESWGQCREWPPPSLTELAVAPAARTPPRVAVSSLTPTDLLKVAAGDAGSITVDACTIVYNPGNYHNLAIV